MPESRSPWPFRITGGLIALCIALLLAFGVDWSDDETEPTSLADATSGDGSGPAAEGSEGALDEGEPENSADAIAVFDPTELAQILYDGGLPDDTPPYEPTLAPPPSQPSEAAPSEAAPPAQPIVLPQTRNRVPLTPERAVSRAVFWSGMLEQRIEQMQTQLEAAQTARDTDAVRRTRRMIERLESQRPALAARIEELEAALPQEEEPVADPEPEAQGEY